MLYERDCVTCMNAIDQEFCIAGEIKVCRECQEGSNYVEIREAENAE